MVCIWTTTPHSKTLGCLAPLLKSSPGVKITSTNDFSVPEGTTVILCLGAKFLARLQEELLVPKGRTITSLRTKPVYRKGIPVLVSYSPDIGDTDYRYYVDFLTDAGLAFKFDQSGSFAVPVGEYEWVQSFSGLIDEIKSEYEKTKVPVEVEFDLETVGTDPHRLPSADHPGAYIVSIGFTH